MATKAAISQTQALLKEAKSRLAQLQREAEYQCVDPQFQRDLIGQIQQMEQFLRDAASAQDMCTPLPVKKKESVPVNDEAVAQQQRREELLEEGLSHLDKYIKKYGSAKKKLVDIKTPSIPLASIGPASANFQAGLNITAKLASKRKKLKITSTASINSNGWLKLFLQAGFKIPYINVGASLQGGIRGDVNLTGSTSISLEYKSPNLIGGFSAPTVKLNLKARLFFTMDVPYSSRIASTVAGWVDGVSASGDTLYYTLGQIDVLTVKAPSYSLSFNMSKGEFKAGRPTGRYTATLHPDVIRAGNAILDSVKNSGEAILDYLNPLSYFD
jgi:hypothetical protein